MMRDAGAYQHVEATRMATPSVQVSCSSLCRSLPLAAFPRCGLRKCSLPAVWPTNALMLPIAVAHPVLPLRDADVPSYSQRRRGQVAPGDADRAGKPAMERRGCLLCVHNKCQQVSTTSVINNACSSLLFVALQVRVDTHSASGAYVPYYWWPRRQPADPRAASRLLVATWVDHSQSGL